MRTAGALCEARRDGLDSSQSETGESNPFERTNYYFGGIMQTFDAIFSRRNVRQYNDKPVTKEALEKILEAGRRSPSASNWQPWQFLVITDRTTLQQLAPATSNFIADTLATIVIIAKNPEDPKYLEWIQYDFGQATMAMMIAATDLGIGTGHASVKDKPAAESLLNLPNDYTAHYAIGLGYPLDRELSPIKNPKRLPLDQIVRWEKW